MLQHFSVGFSDTPNDLNAIAYLHFVISGSLAAGEKGKIVPLVAGHLTSEWLAGFDTHSCNCQHPTGAL